ncbi:MAG: TIGR04086 family membrane protein [Clostridia bacterium]|nr:TIGR04086 family membrane protein [Clostridia bacterium]
MYSEAYKQVKDTAPASVFGRRLVKAVPLAFGLTFVVFALCALLLTYTGLPEGAIPTISIITALLSVIGAGITATRGIAGRGYLFGALTGLFYVFLLYILACLFAGELYVNSYILILLAIGLFGGALGGILGINVSTGKKRY